MAEFSKMVKKDYGIKMKPITTRNPQANAVVERVHQTIGNMIRTFNVETMDVENPWAGILSAVTFAVRSTVHSTTTSIVDHYYYYLYKTVFSALWKTCFFDHVLITAWK